MNLKTKSVIFCGILCSVVVAFSGCSITEKDLGVEGLIHPPKTVGDKAQIENLISENAGKDYILKYPKNGNYRSAIVLTDLDGNDVDEAIAFYRSSAESNAEIHMLIMYNQNDIWKVSRDCVFEAADVDCINFADVNGDGNMEILSGFTTFSTNVNKLACYSFENGKTEQLTVDYLYSSFYTADFDNDGSDEVITLSLYTSDNEASAVYLDYGKEKNCLYTRSSVKMDPSISKFKTVNLTTLGDSSKGLIVDGYCNTDEILTQIIYYKSNLKNPLYNENEKNITQRSNFIDSYDSDGDSIVEIPIMSTFACPDGEDKLKISGKINWSKFEIETESFNITKMSVYDVNKRFYFKIPQKWEESSVTSIYDANNDMLSFYEISKEDNGKINKKDKIFDIKAFSIDNWSNSKEYSLIAKDSNYAYAYSKINYNSDLSIDDDEIKSSFSVINQTLN